MDFTITKREIKLLVNEVELHCIITGTGPCPLLCITGGLLACQQSFSLQLEHFGRQGSNYTVVTFDPRGCGHSRHTTCSYQITPEHYIKTNARDGHAIMNTLGYDKYYVLGWCGGGIAAIHLTALFPSSVQGLIIWGARTFITQHDVQVTEEARGLSKIHPRVRDMFIETYGTMEIVKSIWNKIVDAVIETYKHASLHYNNGELYYKELSSIKCPTLILHGCKDKYTSQGHAEYANKCINDSELQVIDNGRHLLQVEPSFNGRVETFLTTEWKKNNF